MVFWKERICCQLVSVCSVSTEVFREASLEKVAASFVLASAAFRACDRLPWSSWFCEITSLLLRERHVFFRFLFL
jgi:hypothetical protein